MIVMVVGAMVVSGRLNAECAVHAAGDPARDAADRSAHNRANGARSPIARRASDRRPLLSTPHDPLRLSDEGHCQECQSGSERQKSIGHGTLLR